MMGANFNELRDFQKKMGKLVDNMDEFAKDCDKDLAGRLLRYVIPDTPVGKNRGPGGTIKGGTLRRGWAANTQEEAFGKAQGGTDTPNAKEQKQHIAGLPITVAGRTYTIVIINPVEYAMYVEYGHRTRGGKGFVKGQHMLTNSIIRLEPQVPKIIDRKIQKYLDKLEE